MNIKTMVIGRFFKEEKDAVDHIAKVSEQNEVWNLYQLKNGFIVAKSRWQKDDLHYEPIKQ